MSDGYDPYKIHGVESEKSARAGERPGDKLGEEPIATQKLRSIIERMERLAEDKDVIKDDEKATMADANALGFDTKAIRKILKIRKSDPDKLSNERAVLDVYLAALGMEEGL